jgi:hypothetical protein
MVDLAVAGVVLGKSGPVWWGLAHLMTHQSFWKKIFFLEKPKYKT